MPVLEGGNVIHGAIPRLTINPFGETRRVPSGTTIQSVQDIATAGDVIYVDPATYDENLIISTAGLTFVGLGARGEPWINPSSGGGLQVIAADTVLVNLGVAGASGADWALNIKAASECRFYGCKFEGPDGTVVLLDGDDDGQTDNLLFDDCEWAWGGSGIVFDNSGYGYPTQIKVRNSLFHNMTVAHMRDDTDGGGVKDLWVTDNVFANLEDGTEPTNYFDLDAAVDTGFFSGNRLALVANASTSIKIDAGIIWAANATEAGWSTARPS